MGLESYVLPAGNVQIAFSGGRSSAYMLWMIIQANSDIRSRDDVVVVFCNTGREDEATLRFVAEVSRRWQIEVVWVEYLPQAPFFQVVGFQGAARNGEPFEALIKKKKYLPNQQARFCTIELKVRTAKRYLVSLGWDKWTNCVGLRADEPSRLNKPRPKDRWTVWHPMGDAGVSKRDVADFWFSQPFDLQLINVNGKTPGGNCVDCFLKSEAYIAGYHRDNPDDDWSERMEAWMAAYWYEMTPWQRLRRIVMAEPDLAGKMREAYGRPVPSSVITSMVSRPRSAAQFSKRYSRAEMRDTMDRIGDLLLSTEGALCQADDGECYG